MPAILVSNLILSSKLRTACDMLGDIGDGVQMQQFPLNK